jgi:hypothetical protein
MAKPQKIKRVPPAQMWEMYIAGGYLDMITSGDLIESYKRSKHPSPPLSFAPFCTQSQIIQYRDTKGKLILVVHQYLRPDGKLAASGRPDPKRLLIGNIAYLPELKQSKK